MAQYRFAYQTATDVGALTQQVAFTLDECKSYIDQILNVFDIDNCPVANLNIIANILGYPVNAQDDPDFTRRSLKHAINLYKSKGTEESIRVIFYNLGFYVSVAPLWTPDFIESVAISPPYIQAHIPAVIGNPYKAGFYDVTVVNPDGQLFTAVGTYQYIN